MAEYTDDQTILLASHGGTPQVLLCLALEMPPGKRWKLRLDEVSITELWLWQ